MHPFSAPYWEDLHRLYTQVRALDGAQPAHHPHIGPLVSECHDSLNRLALLLQEPSERTQRVTQGLQALRTLQQTVAQAPAGQGTTFWQPMHQQLLRLLHELLYPGRRK